MRRIIFTVLLFVAGLAGYAQTKAYQVEATNLLKAGKYFVWKGDTIRKDSIVYAENHLDSIRFKLINGKWSDWVKPYRHPVTHPPSIIAQDTSSRFVSDSDKAIWNSKQGAINGTGFVKADGSTIYYDPTSYLPSGYVRIGYWEQAYSDRMKWNGDTTGLDVEKGRATLGINNVDNTSDADKPISTAQQAAIAAKMDSTVGTRTGINLLGIDSLGNLTKNIAGLLPVPEQGGITSIGMTVPTGMSVTPGTLNANGNFAIAMAPGYVIPTQSNVNEWEAKEPGLGNPSVDGYVLSSTIGGQRSWVVPQSGPQGIQGPKGDTGETGAQGPAGYTPIKGVDYFDGAQGIQGPKGDTGDTGPQGIQGVQGPKGDAGETGATGATGATGEQGPAGYSPVKNIDYFDGYTPIKGVDYFDGAQGPQGPKGDTGATGAQGIQGIQGPKGDTGNTGATGATGAAGYTPVKGVDYFDGAQGPQGIQGPKGDIGATGAQGIQGPKGDTGNTGATGAQGPSGYTPVKNVDYFDGAQGPQGIQGIQGPKGDTGNTGATGQAGYTPVKGVDYFDGAQGPQGIQGIQGPKGDTGDTGSTGAQGPQGIQGPSGPNYLSSSTGTNLSGIIQGNGADISATAVKTVNGNSILGTGDISTAQTDITGNAGTASALQTARSINGVAFDGTQDITVEAEPLNPVNDHVETTAGSKTHGTNTWVTLTSTSISNAKGSNLLVMFNAPFYTSVTGQAFQLRIKVGGVVKQTYYGYCYTGYTQFAMQKLVPITKGSSYTVAIEWNATTNIFQDGTDNTNTLRTLTVVDLY